MKIIKKMILAASVLAVSVANAATDMNIKYMGQGHSILTPTRTAKYLLLPIEEASSESRISVYEDNQVKENINVRLAKDKVDYYMPYELEGAESFISMLLLQEVEKNCTIQKSQKQEFGQSI